MLYHEAHCIQLNSDLYISGRFLLSTLLLVTMNRVILCIKNILLKTSTKSFPRHLLQPLEHAVQNCNMTAEKLQKLTAQSVSLPNSLNTNLPERNGEWTCGNLSNHIVYCTRCSSLSCLVGPRMSSPKVQSKKVAACTNNNTCFCAV